MTKEPGPTMTITPTLAAERIELAAVNGWLKQGTWHDGEHYACLLGAIDARVNGTDAPCLAHVASRWVLHWTVGAFDGLAKDKVVDAARLYAQLLRDGEHLTAEQWDRVSVEFRCWLIADAVASAKPNGDASAYWPAVESACLGMIAALRAGDQDKIGAAAAAAAAAAEAAAWAAWARAAAEAEAEAAAAEARFRQFEALAKIVKETRK